MRIVFLAILVALCLASIQRPCSSGKCRYTATVVKTDDPATAHDVDVNIARIGGSAALSLKFNNDIRYFPNSDGSEYYYTHTHINDFECEPSSIDEIEGMFQHFLLAFLDPSDFVLVGSAQFFGVKADLYRNDDADLSIYVDASTGMPLGGQTYDASMSWSFVYTKVKAGVNDAGAWDVPSQCTNAAQSSTRMVNGKFQRYTHDELLDMGLTYHEVTDDAANAATAIDYTSGPTRFAPTVLDQGMCGSCWAHGAMSSLFGQIRKIKGPNFPQSHMPSRQYVLDCVPEEVGDGCEGGDHAATFQWLMTHPIPTEGAYPYMEIDHKCDISKVPANMMYPAGLITAVKLVPEGDENALLHALQSNVIAIGVCDDTPDFKSSNDRVAKTTMKCTPNRIGHSVTLVGAGIDEITGEEYWEVQNSWSYLWRDRGHIRIARNRGDQFGVALQAAYPVLDPSKIPF